MRQLKRKKTISYHKASVKIQQSLSLRGEMTKNGVTSYLKEIPGPG